MTTPAVEPAFSETVRLATRQSHGSAQGSPFVRSLFDGTVSRERYAAMAAQHLAIYTALEDTAEAMAADPVASAFVARELHRAPALEADLEFLLGAGWRSEIEVLEATSEYAARIRAAGANSAAFVAHHYVRYLGDLSGGQHIADAVRRALGLGIDGTRFYAFDGILDQAAFKARYRTSLDEAAWSPLEQQRFIDEALLAYEMNTRVLAAL